MPARKLVRACRGDRQVHTGRPPIRTSSSTVDHVREFEQEHGPLPEGGWLLYRTGWDARAHDQDAFLNADDTGPHTPGIEVECSRWLAEETPVVGIGVETVGTDAGRAHSFDPAFPCHSYMLGAGKYGLTQLANLAQLPSTGTVILVAPLKIVGGSGSPCRALAFVPAKLSAGRTDDLTALLLRGPDGIRTRDLHLDRVASTARLLHGTLCRRCVPPTGFEPVSPP